MSISPEVGTYSGIQDSERDGLCQVSAQETLYRYSVRHHIPRRKSHYMEGEQLEIDKVSVEINTALHREGYQCRKGNRYSDTFYIKALPYLLGDKP